jgi:hypothetical protein
MATAVRASFHRERGGVPLALARFSPERLRIPPPCSMPLESRGWLPGQLAVQPASGRSNQMWTWLVPTEFS